MKTIILVLLLISLSFFTNAQKLDTLQITKEYSWDKINNVWKPYEYYTFVLGDKYLNKTFRKYTNGNIKYINTQYINDNLDSTVSSSQASVVNYQNDSTVIKTTWYYDSDLDKYKLETQDIHHLLKYGFEKVDYIQVIGDFGLALDQPGRHISKYYYNDSLVYKFVKIKKNFFLNFPKTYNFKWYKYFNDKNQLIQDNFEDIYINYTYKDTLLTSKIFLVHNKITNKIELYYYPNDRLKEIIETDYDRNDSVEYKTKKLFIYPKD